MRGLNKPLEIVLSGPTYEELTEWQRSEPRLIPDARLRAMLAMAPRQVPPVSRNDDAQVFPAQGPRRHRVALLTGYIASERMFA